MTAELILGAVAYDAKVVTIWDGFRAYCAARGDVRAFGACTTSSSASFRTSSAVST